jgi:integrase
MPVYTGIVCHFTAKSAFFASPLLPRHPKLRLAGKQNKRKLQMPRLTKKLLDNVKPALRDIFTWDSEIRGLGVRIKPSGTKTFFVQYRNKSNRTRRLVIGQYGILTVEIARNLARERLLEVIKGEDPSAERKAARNAFTVKELCDWYLLEASSGRLLGRRRRPIKPSTLKHDKTCIEKHVRPLIGHHSLDGLTRADIQRFHADVVLGKTAAKRVGRGGNTTGGQGAAGRTVTLLHAIFEHGIRMGITEVNPVRGVRKAASVPKDRRLSVEEIKRLGVVLDRLQNDGENATALAAIKFIALTGFRRNEALLLEGNWVADDCRSIRFPDTKTGRQTRIIGEAAVLVIKQQLKRNGQRFVFPAEIGQGAFVGLPRVLDRVLRAANIAGVSLHTLRHTYASVAAELGFSELTIAGLLGHASQGVTQRYIHIDEALVLAANKTSARINQLLQSSAFADN